MIGPYDNNENLNKHFKQQWYCGSFSTATVYGEYVQKQGWARKYSKSNFKDTQDWEFFWLRIWILYYFIVSSA